MNVFYASAIWLESPTWGARVKMLSSILGVTSLLWIPLLLVHLETHPSSRLSLGWQVAISLLLPLCAMACWLLSRFQVPTGAPSTLFYYAAWAGERFEKFKGYLVSPGSLQPDLENGVLLELRPEQTIYFTLPEGLQVCAPGPLLRHFRLKVTFVPSISTAAAEDFAQWIREFQCRLFWQISDYEPSAPGEEVRDWERHLLKIATHATTSPHFTVSDVKATTNRY